MYARLLLLLLKKKNKKKEEKKNAAEFDCSLISVSEIEQQRWTSFFYPSPLRIIRGADRELLNAYETN